MTDDIQLIQLGTDAEVSQTDAKDSAAEQPSSPSRIRTADRRAEQHEPQSKSLGAGIGILLLILFGVCLVALGVFGATAQGEVASLALIVGLPARIEAWLKNLRPADTSISEQSNEDTDSTTDLSETAAVTSSRDSSDPQPRVGPRDRPEMSVADMDGERDVEVLVERLMRTSEERPLPDASGVIAPIRRPIAPTLEGIPQELNILRRDVEPVLVGTAHNETTVQRLARAYDLMVVVAPDHQDALSNLLKYLPALVRTDGVSGLGSARTVTLPAPANPGSDPAAQATTQDLRGHKGEPRHPMARTEPDFIAVSAPSEWAERAHAILSDYAPVLDIVEWERPEIHVAGFVFDGSIELPDHVTAEVPDQRSEQANTTPRSQTRASPGSESSERAPSDGAGSTTATDGGATDTQGGSSGDETDRTVSPEGQDSGSKQSGPNAETGRTTGSQHPDTNQAGSTGPTSAPQSQSPEDGTDSTTPSSGDAGVGSDSRSTDDADRSEDTNGSGGPPHQEPTGGSSSASGSESACSQQPTVDPPDGNSHAGGAASAGRSETTNTPHSGASTDSDLPPADIDIDYSRKSAAPASDETDTRTNTDGDGTSSKEKDSPSSNDNNSKTDGADSALPKSSTEGPNPGPSNTAPSSTGSSADTPRQGSSDQVAPADENPKSGQYAPGQGRDGSSGESPTTPQIDPGPGIVPFGEAPASSDPTIVDVTEHVLNELTFQATATPNREIYSTVYADEEGLIRHHHAIDHPDFLDSRTGSISFTSAFFDHLRRLATLHKDIDHRLAGGVHSHPVSGVPLQSGADKRFAERVWRNQRNTQFIVGVSEDEGPAEWTVTADGEEVQRESNGFLVRIRAFSGQNDSKQIRLHQDMGQ